MEREASFEEAVDQLERIVSAMEAGTLSLDDSLARFQEAVALSRFCAAKLEAAEHQVAVLTAEEGLTVKKSLPWELAEDSSEEIDG